jgi:hypothetical protein
LGLKKRGQYQKQFHQKEKNKGNQKTVDKRNKHQNESIHQRKREN